MIYAVQQIKMTLSELAQGGKFNLAKGRVVGSPGMVYNDDGTVSFMLVVEEPDVAVPSLGPQLA